MTRSSAYTLDGLPLRRRLTRGLRIALERLGLWGPVFRLYERHRAASAPVRPAQDDGRPYPPPYLITLVSSTPDPVFFSEHGRLDAERMRAAAARHGIDLFAGARVLDFGCGCGRIARWLAPEVLAGGGRFSGVDINRRLIAWSQRHLAGDYAVCGLRPPMRLQAASIDVLYARSVLTHLTVETTRLWLDDFHRVLRQGGLAIVTFHDEDWVEGDDRDLVERDGHLLLTRSLEGSNFMAAVTTRAFLAELSGPWFEAIETIPSDRSADRQAMMILRRR
ncbi:MAG TPA: class I SAM-dependent methyltransferase [Phenylobacterium sp.]|nr:class I SAM-dependent methyltransferase [Phenylobacterium sp.]